MSVELISLCIVSVVSLATFVSSRILNRWDENDRLDRHIRLQEFKRRREYDERRQKLLDEEHAERCEQDKEMFENVREQKKLRKALAITFFEFFKFLCTWLKEYYSRLLNNDGNHHHTRPFDNRPVEPCGFKMDSEFRREIDEHNKQRRPVNLSDFEIRDDRLNPPAIIRCQNAQPIPMTPPQFFSESQSPPEPKQTPNSINGDLRPKTPPPLIIDDVKYSH